MRNLSKHILVTGGCGFIGSNIVKRLVREGYYVSVIDDLTTGKKDYIQECLEGKNCQLIEESIVDYAAMERAMEGIDVVIHEAANPDVRSSKDNLFRDFEINVKGTLNILQAMATHDVSKIIFASSAGTVYGETEKIPTPENHFLAPISHYGASKAASEQYLSSFSSLYNIEAYSLRLGNIYGPPSNHGVMFDFFMKLKKDPTSLEILGNGQQVKSYLYVDDCVEAHISALNTEKSKYMVFNITSNEATTVNQIASEMINAMNLKEVKLSYTGGERGWEGDVKRAVVDITKAQKILHWSPKIKISEGIRNYVSWLRDKYP